MRWTAILVLFTGVVGIVTMGSRSFAQSGEYRLVYVGDIIMGYVPDGELIETSGHIWFRESGALLNVSAPSAHVPLRVDVSAVPVDQRTKWAACFASGQGFGGGCQAVVRGRTAVVEGRRGVFAREIEIQATDR